MLVNDFHAPWCEGGKNNMREILDRWRDRHEVFCLGLAKEDGVDGSQGFPVHLVRSPFYDTRLARLFYPLGYLRMVWRARSVVRAEQPDLFFSYFETASTAFFAALARWWAHSRARLVHTVWSDWYEPARAPSGIWLTEHLPHLVMNNRWASCFSLCFVDRILVTSEHLAARVRKLGFRDVVFTPTGVNIRRFHPDPTVRARYGEKLVIGYLGHLSHAKGVSLLLEAALPVLECLDARLILATTPGGEESSETAKIRHPRVTVSQIVDPVEFFNSCDLSVLPRRRSSGAVSYPNVLLESMACGVPVLASDVPAVREVVRDGENGFLFKPQSAEDLRNKLVSLGSQPERLKQAGLRARSFVVENLNWDILAERTEQAIHPDGFTAAASIRRDGKSFSGQKCPGEWVL